MQRRDGFTLLEISLAVMVGLFLALMAVPSVTGLVKDQQVKRSFEAIDELVRQAHARSLAERRPYVLAWERDRIVLRPENPESTDEEQGIEEIANEEGDRYRIELPAALIKDPPQIWTFWPTGTCEPAVIRHEGQGGAWLARYDPLTATAVVEQ